MKSIPYRTRLLSGALLVLSGAAAAIVVSSPALSQARDRQAKRKPN
ncbi:MAG: hypothetical protein K0Q72_459, partial [Armatimonadetes bacterium]|nr:hypothetical protein [Armatimonadota bacterium]